MDQRFEVLTFSVYPILPVRCPGPGNTRDADQTNQRPDDANRFQSLPSDDANPRPLKRVKAQKAFLPIEWLDLKKK